MQTQESIEVLNTLITINSDTIEGYETATNETDEQDLKDLFAKFTETSQKCKQELVIEVTKIGGEVEEGTLLSGKFFRTWMGVKAALTGHDRKAILDSCEYGEDIAVDTYEKALKDNVGDITSDQKTIINAQYFLIKADHDRVKSMRDGLV
jgi:uncharacterized protein (TIGR02284 family)